MKPTNLVTLVEQSFYSVNGEEFSWETYARPRKDGAVSILAHQSDASRPRRTVAGWYGLRTGYQIIDGLRAVWYEFEAGSLTQGQLRLAAERLSAISVALRDEALAYLEYEAADETTGDLDESQTVHIADSWATRATWTADRPLPDHPAARYFFNEPRRAAAQKFARDFFARTKQLPTGEYEVFLDDGEKQMIRYPSA